MGVYSSMARNMISEEAAVKEFHSTNLLEFAIEAQKADQSLFDAMIEMDFREAYAENGVISITETAEEQAKKSAVKKIAEKIVGLFVKFADTVARIVDTLVIKVQQFVNKQRSEKGKENPFVELVKKNGGFTSDVISQFPGKVKVVIPGKFGVEPFESIHGMISAIESETDAEKLDPSAIADKVNAEIDKAEKGYKESFAEVSAENLTPSILDSYGKMFTSVSAKSEDSINLEAFNKMKRETADARKKISPLKNLKMDEDQRVILSRKYSCYTKILSGESKFIKMASSLMVQELATYRATYIKMATFLAKTKKAADKEKKNVKECAEMISQNSQTVMEMYAIDVLNEDYVNSIFED